ncbi:MAG: uroporphyrinogen decarboxylase family protein [Planctomycetota bacterium]
MIDAQQRYHERLARYTTALRNEQPDRVPLRPFVAEWVGRYAGYTCQELAHEYPKAHAAVLRCAADFDWDAMVPNMLATWTGMLQAFGLRYYAVPGIDLPPHVGHQYREPPPEDAYMKVEEYDQLIEDPTGYLYNVWFPRVAAPLSAPGEPVTFQHNLALVKGLMAMNQFLGDLGVQTGRLRDETGTVPAIAGMLRAPFDMLADKLRGYVGLVEDLYERPEKVLAACEALMPHLTHFALATGDPERNVPLGFWMHRGCVPFVSFDQFRDYYWSTLKPIVQELWANGLQTLFYAEGDWNHHLDAFAELPDRSVVFHLDRCDVLQAHRTLGDKFCLSGGVPNLLLAQGTPEEVRKHCRRIIAEVGGDGGYIMDASAIIQNDATVDNLRALTEATHEFGGYSRGHAAAPVAAPPGPDAAARRPGRFIDPTQGSRPAGTCLPWSKARSSIPSISGDESICRTVWDQIDAMGNLFIWTMFLIF